VTVPGETPERPADKSGTGAPIEAPPLLPGRSSESGSLLPPLGNKLAVAVSRSPRRVGPLGNKSRILGIRRPGRGEFLGNGSRFFQF